MNVNLMFIYLIIGCGFLSISVRFMPIITITSRGWSYGVPYDHPLHIAWLVDYFFSVQRWAAEPL